MPEASEGDRARVSHYRANATSCKSASDAKEEGFHRGTEAQRHRGTEARRRDTLEGIFVVNFVASFVVNFGAIFG